MKEKTKQKSVEILWAVWYSNDIYCQILVIFIVKSI